MNDYQKEQMDGFALVREHLATLSSAGRETLMAMAADYLSFRDETDAFLSRHFSQVCAPKCFQHRLSACCSREGIITFFADVVINLLVSPDDETDILMRVLKKPNQGFKCVYLGENGCIWRVKPIVCEMFLCDAAQKEVFGDNPDIRAAWERLDQRKKAYTWPDRPVLFDALEAHFLNAGHTSPLMYLHNSPGLLRVKATMGNG